MDEDLAVLLSDPFAKEEIFDPLEQISSRRGRSAQFAVHSIKAQFGEFYQPAPEAFAIHSRMIRIISETLLSRSHGSSVQNTIRIHAGTMSDRVEEIQKAFRTYINTASPESLNREAERLERRYFPATGIQAQLEFIQIKRYYEKIKTFNEIASPLWKKIKKSLDTLSVIPDTASLCAAIRKESFDEIQTFMRKTDAYLNVIKTHMRAQIDTRDNITGAYQLSATFAPEIDYSFDALFGEKKPKSTDINIHVSDLTEEFEEESSTSIAKNIILETREHKLNRASFFTTNLVGSRDWNRTPEYILEVSVIDYENNIKLFKSAYQISFDSSEIPGKINLSTAMMRKNTGEKMLKSYRMLVYKTLEEISMNIMGHDFPGLTNPLIFLYHCGPNTIYKILLNTFQQLNVGEMFYVSEKKTLERNYPEAILRREIIEWWNKIFEDFDGEEIDSFLSYTKCLEMVNKEYRALYNKSLDQKEIETGQRHVGSEKWLREHQRKYFGIRKIEIFKRFLKDRWFDTSPHH